MCDNDNPTPHLWSSLQGPPGHTCLPVKLIPMFIEGLRVAKSRGPLLRPVTGRHLSGFTSRNGPWAFQPSSSACLSPSKVFHCLKKWWETHRKSDILSAPMIRITPSTPAVPEAGPQMQLESGSSIRVSHEPAAEPLSLPSQGLALAGSWC